MTLLSSAVLHLNVWKFAQLSNWTVSEIRLFYEFVNNGNLTIFEIVKFGTFLELWNSRHFWNCKIWEIFRILKIRKMKNFQNFLNLYNQNLAAKVGKFWNCSSTRYSALLAIFPILIFALWSKVNFDAVTSQFLFPILVTPSVPPFYIWTLSNFKIWNVSHSKILLFDILTLIPIFNKKIKKTKNKKIVPDVGYLCSTCRNPKSKNKIVPVNRCNSLSVT